MNLHTKLCTRLATLSLLLTCAWGASAATSYTFSKLHDLGGKGGLSDPAALSASGIAVGTSTPAGTYPKAVKWMGVLPVPLPAEGFTLEFALAIDSAGVRQAGVAYTDSIPSIASAMVWNWDGGGSALRLQPLGDSAYAGAGAEGINVDGLVVGDSEREPFGRGVYWPVTWRLPSTQPRPLALLPGAVGGLALAVNDRGTIVGATRFQNGKRATRWQTRGGTADDLGSLGGESVASAVNRHGVIVGWSTKAGDPFAKPVKWRNGEIIELDTLDGTAASATAINDSGTVVGYGNLGLEVRAVMWEGRKPIDLNTRVDAATSAAGWVLDWAVGVDNAGRILGMAHNLRSGARNAFMLTPAAN